MTDSVERWLPVVGWEGFYEVSNLGRVKSLPRSATTGRVLKPLVDHSGYLTVGLCKNGHQRARFIAQLVAEAFIGPRPLGCYCCHNDGNPANNRLWNLRWDTPTGNAADRAKHGKSPRGERNGQRKLTEAQVLAIRADARPQRVIAEIYGIHQVAVSLIKRRRRWSHIP